MNPYLATMEPVLKNPQHCFLNESAFEKLVSELATQNLKLEPWRSPIYPKADDDNFVQFLGVLNSINFCFFHLETGGRFNAEYPEGKLHSGSSAMTACLKRAMDDGYPILDPHYLKNLEMWDVKHIFRHKNTPMTLLGMRRAHLRNVGIVLTSDIGINSFADIFRKADYYLFRRDGDGIVQQLLAKFASYSGDNYTHGEVLVEFHKRAQLLPMMYHGRAMNSGGAFQPIRDPENFGAVVDYVIPNVLRNAGVLEYSPTLAELVDAGKEIPKGSILELEIRAQTYKVMHRLVNEVSEELRKKWMPLVTMAEIDSTLWSFGRSIKMKFQHHRTITTAY